MTDSRPKIIQILLNANSALLGLAEDGSLYTMNKFNVWVAVRPIAPTEKLDD